ncbi:hypothetical protein [Gimesia algae]|uniref:Uncharacterized protein n=1 Tax=Gimesia algae TaxID=2527971 RepID=A0A517VHX5_9PLAN|nr:hypothetical protein [Gimesia algae]QDT92605.1 hypothetical protein Pan161_42730 [Gimesia algae]
MTEEFTTPEIVKMDYYIIGPWFKIVVITETELLAATTKATKHADILQLLADEEDPGETLRVEWHCRCFFALSMRNGSHVTSSHA